MSTGSFASSAVGSRRSVACSSRRRHGPAAPTPSCALNSVRWAIDCRRSSRPSGCPSRLPRQHLRLDEETVVRGFLETWHIADPDGDSDVRIARLAGETSRRLAETWLDVWDATARPALASQGAPARSSQGDSFDPSDPEQNPAIKAAVVGRQLVSWLHERQVEQTLNRRIIDGVENALVGAGRLQARPESPPAIAFVDLTGFTTLTVEHGDPAAAEAAATTPELADAIAARDAGGRVVKLLGDGVLLRFDSAADADPVGPSAGRGRSQRPDCRRRTPGSPPVSWSSATATSTVRRSTSRPGSRRQAGPGQVVVEEGAVIALPAGTARFEPLGRVRSRASRVMWSLWLATSAAPLPDRYSQGLHQERERIRGARAPSTASRVSPGHTRRSWPGSCSP